MSRPFPAMPLPGLTAASCIQHAIAFTVLASAALEKQPAELAMVDKALDYLSDAYRAIAPEPRKETTNLS